MAILQKPLRGLAKFWGVTTQGILRINQTAEMIPTFEMTDFIEPPVWGLSLSNAIAQNGNINQQVPQNRLWRIQYIACRVTPPAGVTTNSRVELIRAGTGAPVVISPLRTGQTGVGTEFIHPANVPTGYGFDVGKLVAEPGDTLRLQLYQGTGAGNNTVEFFTQVQEVET